jgi:peptidoglycan/LPS O-acetylase OafA/YrhL
MAVWWPVGATALLLWAGRDSSGRGPELLLARRPAMFVGNISYSLYLWHYPLLMIPTEFAVTGVISVGARLELLLGAVILSVVTYHLVENPVRKSRRLAHSPVLTFAMAVALIASVWIAAALFQHFAKA